MFKATAILKNDMKIFGSGLFFKRSYAEKWCIELNNQFPNTFRFTIKNTNKGA